MPKGNEMLRKEYWDKSKELIEWCNEEELRVLAQQATKALDRRMTAYLNKFDQKEAAKKKAKQKAVKAKLQLK